MQMLPLVSTDPQDSQLEPGPSDKKKVAHHLDDCHRNKSFTALSADYLKLYIAGIQWRKDKNFIFGW